MLALPGLRAPLVTYNLTEGDMSRLARALVHLGEVLLAAGATELYPSVTGGAVARGPDDLVQWWDATHAQPRQPHDRAPHVDRAHRRGPTSRTGADSFGRVWGFDNLRVNDASLLPDAPGVNPQGTIMAIAARNTDHFLAGRADRTDRTGRVDRDRGEHDEHGSAVDAKARAGVRDEHGDDDDADRREQRVQAARFAGGAAARSRPERPARRESRSCTGRITRTHSSRPSTNVSVTIARCGW